jgi:Cu(I)/Ag(I) efflux system membrane fusion protein/cobalt-zinc-cadmium efflux system membrane fusion protein
LAFALLALACGQEPSHTAASPSNGSAAGVELYTCGMHPQVVHEGPGTCPICGMDLTPTGTRAESATQTAPRVGTGERKVKYWVAPMDPAFISDAPGKSPMGMDLVPVYEDEAPGAQASGGVAIDPVVVQNMGVRTEPVRKETVFRHVRSIGEIEVGEDQVSVVNLRFSGWVERIIADKTGDPVKKGQPLIEIYSPELVAAQEEFLLAIRSQGPDSALARSARRKFDLWGISAADLDAIARSGKARRTIAIRAPRSGFVLHKDVVEGARVMAGKDLYRIGDLQWIWVTAEIYENDAPWVEVDQPAQMELSYEEGRVYEGKVAYIYPTLNDVTRTLRVRLEFENPGIRLKPGMFATVYIQFRRADDVLAIPGEAILDSGRRKIVFVSAGNGRFEPREIVTGLVGDRRRTEVLSGLHEGEEIVTSGQFLIDSESQLQEAIQKMLDRRSGRHAPSATTGPETVFSCPMHPDVISSTAGRCTRCGMDLEERAGSPEELAQLSPEQAQRHDHGSPTSAAAGESYSCPMHPQVVSDEPGRCPVCGMFLEEVSPANEDRP